MKNTIVPDNWPVGEVTGRELVCRRIIP